MYNDFIHDQQYRRQEQQYNCHAQQRAAGNQPAHGGDNSHVGIEAHAVGGRKEAQAADQHALRGGSDSVLNRFFFILARKPVLLVAGRHQDGVVHRGAQLDGGDQDWPHEGQFLLQVIRDAQIGRNGQFDHWTAAPA